MGRLLACRKVGHRHHLHDQAGPAGEMLRPLALASFWVILFPGESGSLPLPEHVFNQVSPQSGIHVLGLLLVWPSRGCNVLKRIWSDIGFTTFLRCFCTTHIEIFQHQMVDVDPHRAPPVVLISTIEFVFLAQTPNTIVAPQLLGVVDKI